jgi:hypothetical protein
VTPRSEILAICRLCVAFLFTNGAAPRRQGGLYLRDGGYSRLQRRQLTGLYIFLPQPASITRLGELSASFVSDPTVTTVRVSVAPSINSTSALTSLLHDTAGRIHPRRNIVHVLGGRW